MQEINKSQTLLTIMIKLIKGQTTISGCTDDMILEWLETQQKIQGRENPQIIRNLIVQEMIKDGYGPIARINTLSTNYESFNALPSDNSEVPDLDSEEISNG